MAPADGKMYSFYNTEYNLWCWGSRVALYGMWKGELKEITCSVLSIYVDPGLQQGGNGGLVLLFSSHWAKLLQSPCNP